jgi:hypothetical protein
MAVHQGRTLAQSSKNCQAQDQSRQFLFLTPKIGQNNMGFELSHVRRV